MVENAAEAVAAAGMALPALVTAATAVQEAAGLSRNPAVNSALAPAITAESAQDRSAAAAMNRTAAAAASMDVATSEAALPSLTAADGTRLRRRTVQIGDTIILEVNGERQSFATVREDGCVFEVWLCTQCRGRVHCMHALSRCGSVIVGMS